MTRMDTVVSFRYTLEEREGSEEKLGSSQNVNEGVLLVFENFLLHIN